ncbi:MAG: hypothetical protein C0508_23305 [Cyanobacteria bacterium PR.023]|nr:hypothetical protein [Cyanobacteria bacterium PR.023]
MELSSVNYRLFVALLVSVIASTANLDALARSGDIQVKSGQGEELKVKHSLFGRKNIVVQDRLGDQIEHQTGLVGSKAKVQILGNGYESKTGILGNKSYKISTILGDKVETKKTWFGLGRRKTTVDLSGTTGLVNQVLQTKVAKSKAEVH